MAKSKGKKKSQPSPQLAGIVKYNKIRSALSRYVKDNDIELKKGDFQKLNKDTFQKLKGEPSELFRQLDSELIGQYLPTKITKKEKRPAKDRRYEIRDGLLVPGSDIEQFLEDKGLQDPSYWMLDELVTYFNARQEIYISAANTFPTIEPYDGTAADSLDSGEVSRIVSDLNTEIRVAGFEKEERYFYWGDYYWSKEGKAVIQLVSPVEPVEIPPEEAPAEPLPPEEPEVDAQLRRLREEKAEAREDIKMFTEIGEEKEKKAALARYKRITAKIDKLLKL